MTRALVVAVALTWGGITLLLSGQRWFARPRLADRLRPYLPGAGSAGRRFDRRPLSAGTVAAVLTPLATAAGDRVAEAVGVGESLDRRLRRLHRDEAPGEFRLRQAVWAGAVLLVGAMASVAFSLSPPLVVVTLVAGPLLAVLIVEQHLSEASARRQRRLFLELPVVSEQLGMLLSAGYSLGAALQRLARRGHGVAGADLRRVQRRIEQGLTPTAALREWSDLARVDALDRLVAVLALNQETADLGRLVAEEARSIRRDVQRELIESIERRSQQVWIPVTVAALVPGAIFIAIPFIEALRAFGVS